MLRITLMTLALSSPPAFQAVDWSCREYAAIRDDAGAPLVVLSWCVNEPRNRVLWMVENRSARTLYDVRLGRKTYQAAGGAARSGPEERVAASLAPGATTQTIADVAVDPMGPPDAQVASVDVARPILRFGVAEGAEPLAWTDARAQLLAVAAIEDAGIRIQDSMPPLPDSLAADSVVADSLPADSAAVATMDSAVVPVAAVGDSAPAEVPEPEAARLPPGFEDGLVSDTLWLAPGVELGAQAITGPDGVIWSPQTPRPTQGPQVANPDEVVASLDTYYPPALRAEGVGGEVPVQILVDADGKVVLAMVTRRSGYPDLDRAALAVASLSRWRAARAADGPVATMTRIPVRFQAQ